MRDISFSTSLIHFNGWQPGHCLSYSDGAQRWNAFVPICFVLALSSSAQISTRIQKISHILTVCVGTQYHTKNCCESWLLQIHDHFCVWRMIRVYVQCVSLCVHVTSQLYMYNHHLKKKRSTYGSSTSLSVSLSGRSLSASPFSFSGGGSSEEGRGWDRGPLSTAGGASAGSCDSAATPWHSEEQQRYLFKKKTAIKSKENYIKLVVFSTVICSGVHISSTCLQTGCLGVADWVGTLSELRRSIWLGGCQERDQWMPGEDGNWPGLHIGPHCREKKKKEYLLLTANNI